MTIELTEVDLEIIESWYFSACGESQADQSDETFFLLEKLGIHAEPSHLSMTNLEDVYPEYRAEYQERIDAVRAYRERHPDYEEVQESKKEQP